MPRNHRPHKTPAPPGFAWIDEASRLSGRTIETLYKDRSIQHRTGQCPGPRSVALGRKAAWRIADIKAWLNEQTGLGPDEQVLYNSRPSEPALRRPPPRKRGVPKIRENIPAPSSPEGELFHYTPEEAALWLPFPARRLRLMAFAREVEHVNSGNKIWFSGLNVRAITEQFTVQPFVKQAGSRKGVSPNAPTS